MIKKFIFIITISLTLLYSCKVKSDKLSVVNMQEDEKAINNLIVSYKNGLKDSSVEKVLANYTTDAVLMSPDSPTVIGDKIGAAYSSIFDSVGIDIDFTLANMIIGEKYAFVQSTSDGSALIRALNQTAPEQNRELFVMQRVDGEWKIARYMYNKMDALVPANSVEIVENKSSASSTKDESEIRNLITSLYRDALASGNSEAVKNTFAVNGAVMPPSSATYRGVENIKENYDNIFKNVSLDLQFDIDEIIIEGDYGFVRSTSGGFAKIKATGESSPEVNRELFIVHKENNNWKIAFYMYNKMS
ncbi:nuclear transport factor 2 family protein [Brachyspira aalborgi]|uniref:SnoaL-like domain-containing protein n=1 Tax=Brachyspira aalborgi TaxID=29522 RepID=A0A5C8EEV8_9SPIR|nr:nuclear transport factor 2 family protein [Brachyspira aalborgi]TXJ35521.1 hypothetical protein EPJ78_11490 [Brachyspira aalborgi]